MIGQMRENCFLHFSLSETRFLSRDHFQQHLPHRMVLLSINIVCCAGAIDVLDGNFFFCSHVDQCFFRY